MTRQRKRRRKHIPQRTCVGCRAVWDKRELIRVVRTPQGVWVDPSGRQPGRGAYLHNRRSCWEKGLKGSLARALKTVLTPEDKARLQEFLTTLPEESPQG
jgi:hypothetical protein